MPSVPDDDQADATAKRFHAHAVAMKLISPDDAAITVNDIYRMLCGIGAGATAEAYNIYGMANPPSSLPGLSNLQLIYVQESAAQRYMGAVYGKLDVGEKNLDLLTGNTLFGFAASSADGTFNVLALRGTVTDEEAGYDLYGWDDNKACALPSQSDTQTDYGYVKKDFYNFYTEGDYIYQTLAASCVQAITNVNSGNPNKPWLFASHSLGGAIVTIAALDAVVSDLVPSDGLCVVTFGSLHVGDAAFASKYTEYVPATLRVANLCDFVPSLISLEPPKKPPSDPYVHVGLEVTFVWQTWSDWGNHSLTGVYQPFVKQYWDKAYIGPRTYPQ